MVKLNKIGLKNINNSLLKIKKKVKRDILKYTKKNLKVLKKKKIDYLTLVKKSKKRETKIKENIKFIRKYNIALPNLIEQLKIDLNLKSNKYLKLLNKYKKYKKGTANIYQTLFKKRAILQNTIKIKKKFNTFLTNNKLYNIFNLKQDFPYPNHLQLKSEIQRSAVFRDLINKEESYYKMIKKNPLIILISPKPKNIYITVYTLQESKKGYNILWKKSTGMLQKVEGQLSLQALIELFNKLNIFLTREYGNLQSNVRLIIKSTKYYGTSTIIQNFVKRFEKNVQLNYIYFMYKYRKRFNFFTNYANLINDSVFNYLSAIWLKFLKLIRRSKITPKFLFPIKKLMAYNKFFGIEYNIARRIYKINHFARVKRLKALQMNKGKNFINKNLKQQINLNENITI